jgi:hypothetical protein
MRKYRIRFHGRLKGALGKMEWYTEEVEAESLAAAIFKLYDKYENVHQPKEQ